MTSQFLEALVSLNNLRTRVQQPPGCLGKYIGPINLVYHCWAAIGCVRDQFYSELKQEILRSLDGWSRSVSSKDWVILSLYMIGKSERTASPTILFISENDRCRKEARKLIKDCGILKKYPGFKTAHMSQDPGWGQQLEQLASGQGTETIIQNNTPATKVFYERSKSLRQVGMPIHVYHDSSTRVATANAIRLRGRLFYLAPCHAFLDRPYKWDTPSTKPDNDFEIDSDGEIESEDEVEASITSMGSHSSDNLSDSIDFSDGEGNSTSSGILSHGSSSTSTFNAPEFTNAAAIPLEQGNDKLLPPVDAQVTYTPQERVALPLDSLAPLGVLFDWSIDQDWALIKVVENGDSNITSILSTTSPDISMAQIAIFPEEEANIITDTASSGRMTGTIAGTPSYTRLPRGRSFQEVFSIKLKGPLADGDCGSAVFDAATGKLFGHIVAGSRTSGFAYVMAASHVLPELEKSVQQLVGVPGQVANTEKPMTSMPPPPRRPSVQGGNENLHFDRQPNDLSQRGKMLFLISPSNVIELLKISTRVYIAFKDANENSEAQVEALVREFTTFHHCLEELGELMKEYGKPLPFPCSDFHATLGKCEKTLEPYAEKLVDKKTGPRKFIYTVKNMGKEKEIDGLRKQITGHYQALHMCISFLQLRLHLEATKQTQRLLDAAPCRSISLGGRSYTTNVLSSTSQNPAPDEHPLHSEWRIFDNLLQSEDSRVAQEERLTRPLLLGDTPSAAPSGNVETAAILYYLRRQVEDAILVEETHAIRATGEKRSHLAPGDAIKQKIRGIPPAPHRIYTLDTDHSRNFSGFDAYHMSSSAAIIQPGLSTPSSTASPLGSPYIGSTYSDSNRSSVSTTRSSFSGSSDSRLSLSGLSISTTGTTPESAQSRPLHHRLSATSLATIALGESALNWNGLCNKVQVERQSLEHNHGRERVITETKVCDVHWRHREDTGISLRALYRSSKDGKPRLWTSQHFPATGPSIPLTTTYPDGEVLINFPQHSFGKLDKNWTDVQYTFSGYDSAEKFQTLLYTNNGANAAELKYDRPILSISSNRHATECRGRNLRLWLRSELYLTDNGPVTCDVLVLLFFTSALEEKGHWVEEPHYAFEWLNDSVYKKESDRVTLYFSKDPAGWTPDKTFQRNESSKDSINNDLPQSLTLSRKRYNSLEIPDLTRSGTAMSITSSAVSTESSCSTHKRGGGSGSSRAGNLNRFGYSELEIRFQSKKDRRAFLDIWRQYVKPFGATASVA